MERHYIESIKLKAFDDGSYLFGLPAVQYLLRSGRLSFDQDVTFLIGENGSGKSTLLEAIAVAAGFNAEGGSKDFCFSTRQTVSDLHQYMTVVRSAYEKDGFFLRAESFYNVASEVDSLGLNPTGYGGKSLHAQSHGESFLSLVRNRFRGRGLYILDEPEAALSPTGQLAFLCEMRRLVGADSQFIIATHSPMLPAFPGAVIYQISADGIERTAYEDCEHVLLTKRFLNDPGRILEYLFGED